MPLPVVIDGPRPSAGRRGLLAVASTPAEVPADWQHGVVFQGPACGALDALPVELCRGPIDDLGMVTRPEPSTWGPIALQGADRCSALDGDSPERRERAIDNLNATASWQLEREFFDGEVTGGLTESDSSFGPNPYLTDGSATEATSSASHPVHALSLLEGALADCLHGQRGMIHAAPEVVTWWSSQGLLELQGQVLVTANDNLVVAGSGYSGNDPDGAAPAAGSSWAYGTSLVYVLRDVVQDITTELAARIDTGDDTLTYRVMQVALAYRSTCCTVAAHVDTDVPL